MDLMLMLDAHSFDDIFWSDDLSKIKCENTWIWSFACMIQIKVQESEKWNLCAAQNNGECKSLITE